MDSFVDHFWALLGTFGDDVTEALRYVFWTFFRIGLVMLLDIWNDFWDAVMNNRRFMDTFQKSFFYTYFDIFLTLDDTSTIIRYFFLHPFICMRNFSNEKARNSIF